MRKNIVTICGILIIAVICLFSGFYIAFGPSLACSVPENEQVTPGISGRKLISQGRDRCYLLYIPISYDPSVSTPVVFSLHGFASKPESNRFVTNWEKIADQENFIVVYPQGSSFPLRWNAGPAAMIPEVDDVQTIKDVIEDLSSIANIDPGRIYVAGMSNGGGMTERIACEMADQVAAVGIVAGLTSDTTRTCVPNRPIPLISFFGADDFFADFKIGKMRFSAPPWLEDLAPDLPHPLPLSQWGAAWAVRNGCNLTPENIPTVGDIGGVRYTACDENAGVVVYTIDNGGHTWPGGPSIPIMGKASSEIDASRMMWEFFKGYTLE